MLRTLIIVAALIIVFLIVRNRLRRGQASQPSQDSSVDATRMVQCLSCETYVPAGEAVSDGDRQFCCQQHLRDWHTKT